MTPPYDLTQRVAEAICAGLSPTNGALDGPCERCQRSAPYAVAALLRALRKSEAVKEALIDAKLAGRHEVGEGYHFNTNEQAAVKATVAIAKLADDE